MKKWVILGTVLVLAAVSYVVLPSLVLRWAIISYASALFQTDMDIGSLEFSPYSGELVLEEVSLANPQGFKQPHALQIERISVDYALGTLFSDVVKLQDVQVIAPHITVEMLPQGTNVAALKERYGAGLDNPEEKAGEEVKEAAQQRVEIDRFVMQQGSVRLVQGFGPMKQEQNFDLPEIEMRDIGKKGFELTFADAITDIILEVAYKMPQQIQRLPMEQVKDALEGMKKNLDDVPAALEGLFK